MNKNINQILISLSKSKFRSGFHLNNSMKSYVKDKGIAKIKNDAFEIINKRLKPAFPKNDGKQTPMRQVHPVFISQHACACCCRGCLEKWYKIPKGRELTNEEISFIVSVIVKWIEKEENL